MKAIKDITITIDRELAEAWSKLYPLKQRSLTEFLQEVLAKETLKYTTYSITEAIQNLSGTLKTPLDYKALREVMIEERLKDYENLR